MAGSRCKKNWSFHSSPTWEKTDIPVQSVNQKELSPLMEGWAFLFHSVLHLFGFGFPMLSRTISFTHSIDSNDNLIQKHPHRHLGQCLMKYLHTPSPNQVDIQNLPTWFVICNLIAIKILNVWKSSFQKRRYFPHLCFNAIAHSYDIYWAVTWERCHLKTGISAQSPTPIEKVCSGGIGST